MRHRSRYWDTDPFSETQISLLRHRSRYWDKDPFSETQISLLRHRSRYWDTGLLVRHRSLSKTQDSWLETDLLQCYCTEKDDTRCRNWRFNHRGAWLSWGLQRGTVMWGTNHFTLIETYCYWLVHNYVTFGCNHKVIMAPYNWCHSKCAITFEAQWAMLVAQETKTTITVKLYPKVAN